MGTKVAKILIMATALVAVAAATVVAQSGTPISTTGPSQAPYPTTSKQCYSVPCYGNASREVIYERIGDGKRDVIRAYGNNDRLHANTYTNDTDQVYGLAGPTTSTSMTGMSVTPPEARRATTGATSTPGLRLPTPATAWWFAKRAPCENTPSRHFGE
jgi:hypothetical protein